MSFREINVLEEQSSNKREFRPIRDLIECIRENRDRRRQARQEREMDQMIPQDGGKVHKSAENRNRPQSNFQTADYRRPESYRQQSTADSPYYRPVKPYPYEERRKPAPARYERPGDPRIMTVSDRKQAEQINPYQRGTRGGDYRQNPFMPIPRFTESSEPPLADKAENKTEPITEKVFPDTITVKERNGAVFDIAEDKNATTDSRLSSYLNERGQNLSELDLNGTAITDKGLSLLSKAPNLNKLLLNDTEVNDESMKALGRQQLLNLRELNLHATRVGDSGVAELKQIPLVTLNLSDTIVTDDCLKQLKGSRTLQSLIFDYSGITDEGIKTVKEMQSLRSLSLKGCPVSDDCVADLAKCQQLMLLNLEDTKLSPEKVQWLQKHMPRCVIVGPDGKGVSQGRQQRPFFRLPFESRRS